MAVGMNGQSIPTWEAGTVRDRDRGRAGPGINPWDIGTNRDIYRGSNNPIRDYTAGLAGIPMDDNMYDFYNGSNNADSIVSAPAVDNMYDFYDGSNDIQAKATVAKANAPRKSKTRTKARREVNKAVKDVGTPGTFNFNAAGQRMPNDWAGPSKQGSMNPFARDFDPSLLLGQDRRVNDANMPGGRGAYGMNPNDPINLF